MTISKQQLRDAYTQGRQAGLAEGLERGQKEEREKISNKFNQMRIDLAKGLLSQAQALAANSDAIRALVSDFTR